MQDLSRIGHVTSIKIDDKRTLRYLKAGKGDPLITITSLRNEE